MLNDAILVYTSTGSEQQSITIAEELIQQGLVACVNIIPSVRSIYRFKGKIFDDEENFLIIKTTEDLFEEVSAVITQLHTYEVPEIMAVKAVKCKDNFLNWLNRNVRTSPAFKQASEAGEEAES